MSERALLSLIACCAIPLLLLWGQQSFAETPPHLWRGVLFYACAGLVFLALTGSLKAAQPIVAPFQRLLARLLQSPAAQAAMARLGHRPRRTLLLLGSVAAAYTLLQLLPTRAPNAGYLDAVLLWLASAGLYAAAFWPSAGSALVLRPALSATRVRCALAEHGAELAVLSALTLLGAALRFWQLGAIPDIVSGDEGLVSRMALNAAANPPSPFMTQVNYGTLGLLLMGLPMRWGGTDPMHARMVCALAGALSVPATYLMARAMFTPLIGLVAAILVAVNHVHLHFSRLNVAGAPLDTLFAPLALWLLYRGIKSGRALDFALSGIVIGMHLYFYTGARLIIVVVVAFAALLMLLDRKHAVRHAGHFAALAGGLAIVGAPMALWWWTHPEDFNVRMNQIGIVQSGWLAGAAQMTGRSIPALLWQQVSDCLLMFTYYPASAFYLGSMPLLDQLTAAVFVLGVAYSLWHTREPRFLLLNLWLLASVLGAAALTNPAISVYRVLVVLPAVATLAALGAVKLIQVVRLRARLDRRVGLAAAVAFAGVVALINVSYYFTQLVPGCGFEDSYTRLASRLGAYLRTVDPAYRAYLYGAGRFAYGIHPSVDFLSGGLPIQNLEEYGKTSTTGPPPPALPDGGRGSIFLFMPDRRQELAAVEARYPGGTTRELTDCGSVVMLIYTLPPAG